MMKALVYNGPWDMTLAEFPRPEPAEGEALVKVESVGICGSDVHGFTGESGRRKPGMVMGHEIAGRVVEINCTNSTLKVGDRVTVYNIVSCGARSRGKSSSAGHVYIQTSDRTCVWHLSGDGSRHTGGFCEQNAFCAAFTGDLQVLEQSCSAFATQPSQLIPGLHPCFSKHASHGPDVSACR